MAAKQLEVLEMQKENLQLQMKFYQFGATYFERKLAKMDADEEYYEQEEGGYANGYY